MRVAIGCFHSFGYGLERPGIFSDSAQMFQNMPVERSRRREQGDINISFAYGRVLLFSLFNARFPLIIRFFLSFGVTLR